MNGSIWEMTIQVMADSSSENSENTGTSTLSGDTTLKKMKGYNPEKRYFQINKN